MHRPYSSLGANALLYIDRAGFLGAPQISVGQPGSGRNINVDYENKKAFFQGTEITDAQELARIFGKR